jgi:hypothetical protein
LHRADLGHAALEHQIASIGAPDHYQDHEERFDPETEVSFHLLFDAQERSQEWLCHG